MKRWGHALRAAARAAARVESLRVRAGVVGTMLFGIGLAGCSSGPPFCEDVAPQAAVANSYTLGSGDQVQIVVFRQTDLSGQFALDGNGFLALPLVGQIEADGMTTRELEEAIEARMKEEELLVNPQVSVQVLTYRPFYVLGEVNKPGSYPYRDGMTAINAVALAGGYTYRADQSDIRVDRGDCQVAAAAETAIRPGDIVTVEERFF